MPELVVVVPSRGRPEAARALVEVFKATCTANTELAFALDDNDETRDSYPADACLFTSPSRSMGEALHNAVSYFTGPDNLASPPLAVAFMGDDHRPRTVGWDRAYLDALHELGTGIVYGNDLLQGERLATQCAMTSDIIRALGHMAPTSLVHLYFDDYWMSLGRGAGCLRYLSDVVVEHMHPFAGKAEMDAGYARVNDQAMYSRDEAAFHAYVDAGHLTEDIGKVRTLRGTDDVAVAVRRNG